MATDSIAPTRLSDRIDTLDVMRGIAICGILLMNIPYMGMTGERGGPAFPAALNADWISWGVQQLLFEGTMRGLFTMLFGAGMLLMLRRAEDGQVTPIDVWTRRCLALMALGVVQFTLFVWPGEILWCYGVTGLGLLAFRTARPRTLLITAAIALVAMTAMSVGRGYARVEGLQQARPALAAKAAGKPLTDDQKEALQGYEKARSVFHPTPKEIAEEVKQRTHWSVFAFSAKIWAELNLTSDGWSSVLESFCFMLIGMALFRTGVLTGEAPRSTYATLMIVGYGGGLGLRAAKLMLGARTGFDLDMNALVPWQWIARSAIYEPARSLVTLGHVGLIATLFRSGALGRATPLRALGRMALTVYSLESILTSLLFYAGGYVGVFGFAQLMAIAALIWMACALFCLWWLRSHAMGPAESLLRAVAYGTFRRPCPKVEASQVLATAPPL